MKTRYVTASALCLAAIWVAAPVNAQIIIDSTQQGLLLSDDFETSTVGDPPADPPWNIQRDTPIVGNSTTFPGITPNSGTNFVQLTSGGVAPGDAIGGNFSSTPVATGNLTLSFAFWMVQGTGVEGDSRFRVDWYESSALTNLAGQIGFNPISAASATGTVQGTSLTFNKNEWTNVTLTINASAPPTGALTVTVNGISATANMLNSNDIFGLQIITRSSGGPTVYIDAIPEPSSMCLLAAGLAGGLMLPRRRRRSGTTNVPSGPRSDHPVIRDQAEAREARRRR